MTTTKTFYQKSVQIKVDETIDVRLEQWQALEKKVSGTKPSKAKLINLLLNDTEDIIVDKFIVDLQNRLK